MSWETNVLRSGLASLCLREVRRIGREHHGRLAALGFGALYTFLALYIGPYFLYFTPPPYPSYSLTIFPWTHQTIWWQYPLIQVLTPTSQLVIPLPFLVAILVTAALAGMGMAAAINTLRLGDVRHGTPELRPQLALGLAFVAFLVFLTSLVMDGVIALVVISNPLANQAYQYAWYLYPLEILTNVVILLVLEGWLVSTRNKPSRGETSSRPGARNGTKSRA